MNRLIKSVLLATALFIPALSSANISPAHAKHDIKRIVSAGNGVTEMIYAMGAGNHVVAVDQTSSWPAEVNELPKLGYHKLLSSEGILALNPTILIGTDDMGPKSTLEQLKSAGVEVAAIPLKHSVDSIKQQIMALAEILNKKSQGEKLWAEIKASLDSAAALAAKHEAQHGKKVPVLFVLAMGGRAPSIAGSDTAANTMIELAGGYNPAAQRFKGYKALSSEVLLQLAPEVIVFPGSTSNPDLTPQSLVEKIPVLKETPAGRNGRIVAIDGTLLLGGLGPRTGEVALSLAKIFYND